MISPINVTTLRVVPVMRNAKMIPTNVNGMAKRIINGSKRDSNWAAITINTNIRPMIKIIVSEEKVSLWSSIWPPNEMLTPWGICVSAMISFAFWAPSPSEIPLRSAVTLTYLCWVRRSICIGPSFSWRSATAINGICCPSRFVTCISLSFLIELR